MTLVMTTYTIIATWGAMKLSEEMDIKSDLTPENETQYAENFILDKGICIFGNQFITGADEIKTEALMPNWCCLSLDTYNVKLEVADC